jgi:hypothetical protein
MVHAAARRAHRCGISPRRLKGAKAHND